jgi:hypothetical protein
MIVDKALANCEFLWNLQGGDTGRRRVEHRSFQMLNSLTSKSSLCRLRQV